MNYQELYQRLVEAYKRDLLYRLLVRLFRALSVVLLVFIASVAAETFFHFGISVRTVLFWSFWIATAAIIAGFSFSSFLELVRSATEKNIDGFAARIGNFFPEIKDTLVNILQLARERSANQAKGTSTALADAAIGEKMPRLSQTNFRKALDRSHAKRAHIQFVTLLTAVLVLFVIFFLPLAEGLLRLKYYSTSFVPPPPFQFVVSPGTATLTRGESFVITARTEGDKIQAATLVIKNEGASREERIELRRDTNGAFIYPVQAAAMNFGYHFEAQKVSGDDYFITVTDKPILRSLTVTLTPPAYTKQATTTFEPFVGDVTGLIGSHIRIDAVANHPLESAHILFGEEPGQRPRMPTECIVEGTKLHAQFAIERTEKYMIVVHDREGKTNDFPPMIYSITAITDATPHVEILRPEMQASLTEDMRMPVLVRTGDDYGISKLELVFHLAASKYSESELSWSRLSLPLLSHDGADQSVSYVWNLASLTLAPGDVLEYYAETFDNDAVHGPKSSRSEIHTLRVPTIDEVVKQTDELAEHSTKNLEDALHKAEEVKARAEEARRELAREQKQPTWQQKKKMEDIVAKEQAATQSVEEAAKALDQMTQTLSEQKMISPETLEKYMELQQMMQNISSNELKEAMRKLAESMKKMDPNQMRDALKNFQFNEEAFRASIERTLELLKRIQLEQKIDETIKKSEQLAKEQEELSQKTADQKKLAEEQRDLAERTKELTPNMEDLARRMKDLKTDEQTKQELQKAQEALSKEQPSNEMQEASRQMSQKNKQGAQSHQQKAQQGLKKFSQSMKDLKKELTKNQNERALEALRKISRNLNELSRDEESISSRLNNANENSRQLRELAREQAGAIENLSNVTTEMMELSKESFAITPEMAAELSKAFHEMKESVEKMEARDKPRSMGSSQNAMASLNEASSMSQNAMAQAQQACQNPGAGQGSALQKMLDALGEMAGEQESINQGMRAAQGTEGSAMSMAQQAEMGRLVAQQEAARKSVEELAREAKEITTGKKNTLGNLDQIGKEMEEVVESMRQHGATDEVISRQERILSRLLDASHSQRERDYDDKRKSQTGKEFTLESPSRLGADLLRSPDGGGISPAQAAGYTKEFEALIKKYFDALTKVNKK